MTQQLLTKGLVAAEHEVEAAQDAYDRHDAATITFASRLAAAIVQRDAIEAALRLVLAK